MNNDKENIACLYQYLKTDSDILSLFSSYEIFEEHQKNVLLQAAHLIDEVSAEIGAHLSEQQKKSFDDMLECEPLSLYKSLSP